MAKFTHYFVYGNTGPDFTLEKMKEWEEKIPKKFNMELVFSGVSNGTTEDILVILKGKVTDFEKLYTIEDAPPIIDRRTIIGGSWPTG